MRIPSWMPLVLVGLLVLAYVLRYLWVRWSIRRMMRKLDPLVAEFKDEPVQQLGELAYLHKVGFEVWQITPQLWRARDDNNVHGHGKTEVEAVQDMMRRARERERKQQMVN